MDDFRKVSASGRSAISRHMSRKLLAVDRHFISLHSSRYWCKNVAIFPLCIAKIVVETESLHFVAIYRTLKDCGKSFFQSAIEFIPEKGHMSVQFANGLSSRHIYLYIWQHTVKQDHINVRHVLIARFPAKTYLDNHLKVHSDQRPYQCTQCDKRFRGSTWAQNT